MIVLSDHKLKKLVQTRKRCLDKAIEGLGQHGMVGTSDETLTNLHDALKVCKFLDFTKKRLIQNTTFTSIQIK